MISNTERFVLEAVANDFESLEDIMDDVSKWRGDTAPEGTVDIAAALSHLVQSNQVQAFRLSTDGPPRPAAQTNGSAGGTVWYLITDEGRKNLLRLEQQSSTAANSSV